MTLAVTPLYAALLALIFVFLSARVIAQRVTARISVGDGDDKELRKRMRVHANFAEYVAIGVILLLIAELQDAPVWFLHVLGLSLLIGRILHAIGMSATPQIFRLRQAGMLLTFTQLTLSALAVFALSLS